MKNLSDSIGNRNRNLPACCAMTQPNCATAVLRQPLGQPVHLQHINTLYSEILVISSFVLTDTVPGSDLDLGLLQWLTQEFCSGGGVSTNSVEDRGHRERGSGGGSPLVRGSGGSRKMVQKNFISYSKIFLNFWYFKTIYGDNQFICHC